MHSVFLMDKNKIIKISQVKSKDRIIFPKPVRMEMNIKEGDHIAFIKDDGPGIRVQKASFENFNGYIK